MFEFLGRLEEARLVYRFYIPGKERGWVVFPESVHRRPSQFELLMREERERERQAHIAKYSKGLYLIQ